MLHTAGSGGAVVRCTGGGVVRCTGGAVCRTAGVLVAGWVVGGADGEGEGVVVVGLGDNEAVADDGAAVATALVVAAPRPAS